VCGFFCRSPLTDWEQKLFEKLLLRCLIRERYFNGAIANQVKSGAGSWQQKYFYNILKTDGTKSKISVFLICL
jgi:hypothetical protein